MIDTCAPAKSLYIAVPTYDGWVTADMAFALARGTSLLEGKGVPVTFDILHGGSFVDHQRNILATNFMASGASDMMWIDADVGFEPEHLVYIASLTRPFIGGIYPKRTDSMDFAVSFDKKELWSNDEGFIEASGVGFGFLRINRAVFEALESPTYKSITDSQEREYRRYFECGVSANGMYVGEDIHFCSRWRSIGGKVYVLPHLTMKHSGTKTWQGNWGEWMLKRNNLSA